MGKEQRKTNEQQCEPRFHLRPAFPEEAGLFYTLTPEEDEALGTVDSKPSKQLKRTSPLKSSMSKRINMEF